MPEELNEDLEQNTLEDTAELQDETPDDSSDDEQPVDEPVSDEAGNAGEEPADSPPEETISDNRRVLARSYGFSDTEIESFGNDSRIDAALSALDRRWSQQFQAPKEQEQQQQPVPQTAPQGTVSEQIKLTLDGLEDDDPLKPKLEQVAKFMDQEQARVERLEQALGWMHQQTQQSAQQSFYDHFDSIADASNIAILGKGRNAVRGQIVDLYAHMVNNVGLAPNVAVERAARAVFPEEFEKQAQQARAKAVRKRSQQRTGATSRSTKTEYNGDVSKHPEVQSIMRRMAEHQAQALAGV